MNTNVSVAVGAVAAVAFAGAAFSGDTQTINGSQGYVPSSVADDFFPSFFTAGNCTGNTGDSTGNCTSHGVQMVMQAAGFGPGFFGGAAVPAFDSSPSSGYVLASTPGFDNGLFTGSNYFAGLSNAWSNLTEAAAAGDQPMGLPEMGGSVTGADNSIREQWVDQTVVGYIESFDDTDGNLANGGEGAVNYAQNFRSQLSWSGVDVGTALADIDQRLEQSVDLGDVPYTASAQTLSQVMEILSDTGDNADRTSPGAPPGGAVQRWGQLVAQDVEGYFFSCINCDTPELLATGAGHAFTPAEPNVQFMPYSSAWHVVPTISHGTHGPLVM